MCVCVSFNAAFWTHDSREPVGLVLGLVFSQIYHELFILSPRHT